MDKDVAWRQVEEYIQGHVKIASDELKGLSEYTLKKMFDNAEIDKCPICRRYHTKKFKTFIIYNLSLCDECSNKNILKGWLKNG